ncbi:MAG: hypothetical protein A2427_03405 [Candidatus Nealsonbacteria bacterium RIFOXYC1_FULL_40_7]|uniref:Uncharacterized protein n=1 Tax=Candidatus Nealsonbacteria bacterium RIFOXYC1_FULL_40_7 TaxID=1801678 RepID=A0A1G2EQL0_9BACT|nr:MAG: hypothetical protein A2427_03405 [Candidatus Nealsonbacteria bacterium RIFOXYC1_FULL_40_7]
MAGIVFRTVVLVEIEIKPGVARRVPYEFLAQILDSGGSETFSWGSNGDEVTIKVCPGQGVEVSFGGDARGTVDIKDIRSAWCRAKIPAV